MISYIKFSTSLGCILFLFQPSYSFERKKFSTYLHPWNKFQRFLLYTNFYWGLYKNRNWKEYLPKPKAIISELRATLLHTRHSNTWTKLPKKNVQKQNKQNIYMSFKKVYNGPSINDFAHFLRFLTPPSPLSPILLYRLMD